MIKGKRVVCMLNTVLFDMGGTLEDIWNNEETLAAVMEEFREKVLAGLRAYKSWSESVWLEKKRRRSGRTFI